MNEEQLEKVNRAVSKMLAKEVRKVRCSGCGWENTYWLKDITLTRFNHCPMCSGSKLHLFWKFVPEKV
jgi:DNA-directed RNA polymerase subunit RPC12/RpoP